MPEGCDPTDLDEDEFFVYTADAATGGFYDACLAKTTTGWEYDRLNQTLFRGHDESPTNYAWLSTVDETTGANVAVASLDGDGAFGTWIGRNKAGDLTSFLTYFGGLLFQEPDLGGS